MTRRIFSALALAAVLGGGACNSTMAEEITTADGYTIRDGISIPASLTGAAGDPATGRKVAIDRRKGNCLACHVMPISEQSFHGEVGPDLNGVGSRLSEGELRLRVVDPKVLNPDTIMPAFYRTQGFHRVLDDFAGKSVLTAEEVEDVVAYLATLK